MERNPLVKAASGPSLAARLFEPVDIAFLVYLRIIFGGILLWEVCRYFTHGWISRYYIEPLIHFTYYGFGWVRPWGGDGMYWHFYALGFCAFCILIGFCYRIAAALFFLGFTYVFLLDQTQYLNHFYLISLISLLLAFMPAHRALSVDARLRPQLRSEVAPAWTLWLLRFQIGVPYFFGGVAKLGEDWLRGEPMRMWLAERRGFPIVGPLFEHEWAVYFFVIGGLLLDLLIVPALLWKPTRLFAFAGALAFHLLNAYLFQIGIFPWFMLAATLVFFPPETTRQILRWLCLRSARRRKRRGPHQEVFSNTLKQKVGVPLLVIYAGFQCLMPLRHFLYPGEVNWTEEGHRFSWHMKFRTKQAEGIFTVRNPVNGETRVIEPREHLTERQYSKMVSRPDMILQFSHYLADQEQRDGRGVAEVRARIMASLNGRRGQLLIDPETDLAKEPRTLMPAGWILPLTESLPEPERVASHSLAKQAE